MNFSLRKIEFFVLAMFVMLLQACTTLDFAPGTYVGTVVSSGEPTPMITNLFPQATDPQKSVYGSFMYKERGRWVTGYISSCKPLPDRKLACQWNDKYGRGAMEVTFNENYTAFDGVWGTICATSTELTWTGKKP